MYTTVGTYYSFQMTVVMVGLFQSNHDNRQSSKNRIIFFPLSSCITFGCTVFIQHFIYKSA